MDKRKGGIMRQLQKHHTIYEQLKSYLKTEIVIREEILSLLRQDYTSSLDANLGPLLKTLKGTHKEKHKLVKKILRFNPLSTKEIPLHTIVDLPDELGMNLLTLMQKTDTLKQEILRKNSERKNLSLFEKTFTKDPSLLENPPTKKTQTLTIEVEEQG